MKKVYGFLVLAVMLLGGMTVKAQCTDYTSVPYTTGFEGIATGSLPACWSQIQTGTSGSGTFPCVYEYAANTRTGNCYFEFEASSSSSTMEVVALPMMQDINTLMLNMWVSSSSSYPCVLEVGVLEDDSTFTSVETLSLITFSGASAWKQNYHEYTVLFNNYTGYGERIAIRAVRIGTGQFTLFIDDLTVMTAPSCMHPLSVTASNVTSYSADLSINGVAPAFRVYYTAGSVTDSVDIYDTTYTITGLSASTTYDINVVSLCDDGTITTGVTTSFRTPCDAGGCDVVINMTDSYGDGWNGNAINGFANGTLVFSATIASGSTNTLTYSHCSTDTLSLVWVTGNYAYEASFTATLSGQLLASGSGDEFSSGQVLASVAGCPTCPAPSNLVIDATTSDGVTFHFTSGGEEIEWAVGINDSVYVTSDTVQTVTGLNANTYYNVTVRSICGVDDTSMALTGGFRTACGATTIPYVEGFEGMTTMVAPSCWDVLGGTPRVQTGNQHSGNAYLHFVASTANTIALPPFDQPTGTLQVRFWTRPESTTSNYCGTFSVGYMTDLNNTSSFVELANWSYSEFTDYEEKEVPMVGAPDSARIVLRHNANSTNWYWYVDDLVVEPIPSCARPTTVSASNITYNSADITFVATGTSFRIYYSDGTTTDSVDVYDTTYTLSTLAPRTNYTVTVVTICDDGSVTLGPSTSFTTPCTEGGCQVLFDMTDDFGDGWNDAGIRGIVNGVQTFVATLNSGSAGTYTYDLCTVDTIAFVWVSGMYDDEATFTISAGGSVVVTGVGDSYNNGDTIGFTIGCPTCPSPVNFVASGITSNSANISWSAGGSETEWYVIFGDSTFTTTTPNASFSGLNPNTSYTVTIASICGSGDTSMVLTGHFRTACGLMSIPYSDDFEGYTTTYVPPTCWDVVNGEAYVGTSYPHGGSQYLHFSGGSPNSIALPAMSQPTGTLQVRFWTRPESFTSSSCGNFEVGYMTNLNVDSTYVMVASWPYNSFSAYEEKEVPLFGAPDSARIVLRQTNNASYYYWYVDDLVVEPIPACPRPSSLVATTVTDNQIDISFAGSTSGDYILYISDGAGYSDTVSVTADSTHSFTGLTQLTTYTISVVSDCGSTVSPDRSITVGTTMVADLLPVNTGFEVGQDTNWLMVNGSQTNMWYIGSATNNGGSRALYISDDNGTSNSYNISATSNVFVTKLLNFDSVGDYAISYDWKANAESCCDYLRVFLAPGNAEFTAGDMGSISTTGAPTGWISLDGGSKLNQNSNWQNYSEVFTLSNAGNYNLVFFWHNDGSVGSNPPAAIDNVQLNRLNCPQPQNIVIDALTDATATLHWTPAGSETEWAVTCNGVTTFLSTTSTTITGLEAAHSYNVEVRAVCGVGDTSFAAIANFVTDMCGSAVTVENWDSTMAATTSSYSPVGYSTYNYSYVQTIIPASRMDANGTEITAMAFRTTSASAGTYFTNMDVYLANVSEDDLATAFIMPDSNHQFVQVIANADFSYSTADWQLHAFDSSFTWDGTSNVLVAVNRRHGSWTSGSSFAAHEDTVERTRYDYRDTGPYSINTIDPTDGDPDYDVGDIRLISCGAGCPTPVISSLTYDYATATVVVAGNNIGYELTYGTDPSNLGNPMTSTDGNFTITGLTPATQYFIAVTQMCDSGVVSNPAMRNFTTDSLPCFEPTGLAVVNTTFNSAELSWTSAGSATSWVVSIAGAGATRYDTVSTNPYTITGLYADQQYTVMVMALCGGGAAQSGWSEPLSFTTDICTPVSNVTVDNVTATSAQVNWSAVQGSMGYKLYYGYPDFYEEEAETAEVPATATSYTITGLTAETQYEVYVRNRCTEILYSNVTANDRVGFTTGSNGIYDVESGTLTLYPNPASEKVTVTVTGFEGQVEVEIVDMNGRVSGKWRVENGELTVDVSELAQGAYFVRVTGDSQTAVRKLIVK